MMRPRRCGVDLSELTKDQIVVLWRDPHAGITDLDQQLGDIALPSSNGFEPDATARRREVDGIAEQIADHVRHFLAIRDDRRRGRLDVDLELQVLALDERFVERGYLTQHVDDREGNRYDGELVGRAAGVREDLTDLREELASTADDSVDALHLAIGERTQEAVAKNLGVRDHRRERCAQVVRDVGEKLRLQLVARTQVSDLLERGAQLDLEHPHALVRTRGRVGVEQRFCFRFHSRHSPIPPSETGCAISSISSSSSSIASSSCWRFRSAQYRPPAASSSSCRPCSTISPASSTTIQLASRIALIR